MAALREGFLLGSGCLAFSWEDWVETKPQVQSIPLYSDMQQAMMAAQMGQETMRRTVMVAQQLRNGLKVRHVPVWAMYPDPYGKTFYDGKYVVEEMKVDREELEEGLAAGRYDSLDGIGEPKSWDLEDDYRWHQVELEPTSQSRRKRDLLQIYYGNFYSKDERKLCLKNWRAVVANGNAVIALSSNPYYTQRIPYLWTTPLPFNGRPWGRSAVSAAASQQEELNKIFNLMIDNAMYAVLSLFRRDPNKASDPIDLQSISPGDILNGEEGFLEQISFNFIGNNLWPMVQKLQQGIGDAMRIQEIAEGKPTARGDPTATEIQTVASLGQAHIHNLARDLERNDLERSVQIVYEMSQQFLSDTSDPRLRAMIEEWQGPTPMMDETLRLEMLDTPFKIKARGVSMILKREQMAQKLQQALMLAQGMPLPPINIVSVYYQLIQAMGLDPAQLGLPPSPQEAIEAMQLIAMQQAQGGGQGASGGAGGARPAAPEPSQQPQGPSGPPQEQDVMNQMAGQMPGPSMPGM